jgi:hypothetical protein
LRAALLATAILLAGCNDEPKHDDATVLAMQSGEQSEQIRQLQDRLDKLENNEAELSAREAADATEVNASLDTYRNVINNNVKIDNERAAAVTNHIEALERRVYGTQ